VEEQVFVVVIEASGEVTPAQPDDDTSETETEPEEAEQ
jgi:hypothetical protein